MTFTCKDHDGNPDDMEEATRAINNLTEAVQVTKYPTEDPLIVQPWYDELFLFAIRKMFPLVDAAGWDYEPTRHPLKLSHMGEVRACIQWLRLNGTKTKTIRTKYTSYSYKHFVERSTSGKLCGQYVSNGCFCASALLLGYNYKVSENGVNLYFNMKTPTVHNGGY